MVKIKVCGITNLADAEKALELGADALGFNFYPPSARQITPETARAMLEKIAGSFWNVAVFVNEPKEKVAEVLGKIDNQRQSINCVQFHGEESGDYCRSWKITVIKAFRVKEKKSLENKVIRYLRIEVAPEEMPSILKIRTALVEQATQLGYKWVNLDLSGYKLGGGTLA